MRKEHSGDLVSLIGMRDHQASDVNVRRVFALDVTNKVDLRDEIRYEE